MIGQAGEHVTEPSLRIDVEFGSRDQGVDCCCPSAAFVRAGEDPSGLPRATARSSRSAALLDMQRRPSSRKRVNAIPTVEEVIDCFARIIVLGNPGALLAQPSLQRVDEPAGCTPAARARGPAVKGR